jgi:hypothetical protein
VGAHRVTLSWVLLGIQAVVSVLHGFPRLVYRPNPQTARIVEFINSLGPYWVVAFGLSTVALVVSLVWHRYRHIGHLACMFTWVVFAVALWFGALASNPIGPILFACVATGLVLVHLVIATAYADDPRERRHRER